MLSREKLSKAVGLGLILRAAGWKAYVPESQLLSRLFFGGGAEWRDWVACLEIDACEQWTFKSGFESIKIRSRGQSHLMNR